MMGLCGRRENSRGEASSPRPPPGIPEAMASPTKELFRERSAGLLSRRRSREAGSSCRTGCLWRGVRAGLAP